MNNLVNNGIERAVELLQLGEIVALPTETVYGLAADATNDLAVAKVFAAKGRPSFNPLIIHMHSLEQAETVGVFSEKAREYAKKYWPGALTIVVPKKDANFASLASAGLNTLAIRVPAHSHMQEVLQKSGLMLAAPSANKSGRLSPTEAAHVREDFPTLHIIDGGKCEVGLESTVITFEGDEVIILREGVLQIAGKKSTDEKIISPGQLLKHYAPKSPIRINAAKAGQGEVFVGFGDVECDFNLSKESDLIEAAANLFSMLHQADSLNKKIAVAKIPDEGVGAAINDRLRKACEI